MRRSRIPFAPLIAVLLALALAVTACAGGDTSDRPKITIGAFNFNESLILANLYAGVLRKTGYDVDVRKLTTREVIEPALEKGDVEVVPEYVGTLTEFLNKKANGPDAAPLASADVPRTVQALTMLARPRGLTVLEPSRAADENAFAVTEAFAAKNGLVTLSDLARYRGRLILGGPPECPRRPFCEPGLRRVYGLRFTGFRSLDAGGPLTKQALTQGTIDVGLVFSSDGAIDALNLRVLDDDKSLQTADNVVPVVRTAAVKPDLVAALNTVSAALTNADLVAMNRKADVERKSPDGVARDYLREERLA
ncbi:MAG TPA: ABC transporter substrate-binding protein [Mycobacteriales bacterium]|nr:ABC transporter substrate-binding protein [Mycobacteriales bacterium]